jgi:biopolymer transport protein ExbD
VKRRKKRGMPITVPTASMGDIAFLLTIFFMVCSNFAKENGIQFTPPKAVDVATVADSSLSVAMDVDGIIYLNGQAYSGADDLESSLEATLKDKTGDDRNVLFKCDETIEKRAFAPVLDAIVKAGGVVIAIGEKKPVK